MSGESAWPESGTSAVPGPTSLPVTVAFGQLPPFGPAAAEGQPAIMRFRWPEQLLPGDVIRGLRDPWAVVAHVTRSGRDVTIRVQEAGGSRTMAYRAQQPGFGVRSDIRVDPSTIPDIPDGFPPRWGVWRQGVVSEVTLAWYPEPGKAAEHARQASRDGQEYVVELEAPDGSWTQVDAYQHGRRSTWGQHLAAGLNKTVTPPWATPGNNGTADLTGGPAVSAADSDEAGQGKAPDHAPAPRLAGRSFPAHVQAGPSAKTTWTARTEDQIVAALARKGWSRDSARDACQQAACDGFAATTNKAGDLTAFVTFGDTEVDLWDAEIKPGGGTAARHSAQAPAPALGPVSATGSASSARPRTPRRAPGRGR